MDESDGEDDFRVFANRSGPVVTDDNRRHAQNRAPRWNPGDSDAEDEVWRRRALQIAVDSDSIKAAAPMLQVDFQKLERDKAEAGTLNEDIERSEKIVRSMAVEAEGERVGNKRKRRKGKKERLRERRATGVEV